SLETGTRRHHRVPRHERPQCLVYSAGVSAAHCASQAMHERSGHADYARGRLAVSFSLAATRRVEETPMPRIPYPDLDKVSPEAREMLARLPSPANVFNMMAH